MANLWLVFKRLPAVVLLAPVFLCAQNKVSWSTPQVIRTTSYYVTAPRIKCLSDSVLIAVWGESSNPPKIWCSRLQDTAFGAPVNVVNTTPAPALFGFGGFDVAVSGQNIYVVFERNNQGVFVVKSEDGGLSFLTPVKVQGVTSGTYVTLSSIATDEQGRLFVDYIQTKSGVSTHQMRRSSDGGLTFLPAVDAGEPADGNMVCECCIAAPVAANGQVWLAFRNNNADLRDHWVSHSSDSAATFNLAVDVDNTDWHINVCPISGPRMALSGDTLVTVWKTGAGAGSKVFASTLHAFSMIPGQQIRLGDVLVPNDNQNQPDIAASGDTIGVVFQEDTRIAFQHSTVGAGGLTGVETYFETPGQALQYPTLTYRNHTFHLCYWNAVSGEISYLQGMLSPTLNLYGIGGIQSYLKIFPNPSSGEIRIYWPQNAEDIGWAIYALQGSRIMEGVSPVSNHEFSIDLSALTPGMYVARLGNGRDVFLQKIIKN